MPQDLLQEGDIFMFGPTSQRDYHKLHLGIFMGEFTNGDPLIWHATNHSHFRSQKPNGGVLATLLSELLYLKAYQQLFGIRRFR